MKNEGLKFTHLEVENFKNIDKKIVEINGQHMLIAGKNGAGKSSLIQALLSPIDSKLQPTQVTKKGEEKASTKVVIAGTLHGEATEYTLETYYTPKNQKGRLVMYNSKGEIVKSPASMLKQMIGNVTFDIFKFLDDTKANKIKVLKELSGVSEIIWKLDQERKTLYDERTFKNKKVDELEVQMNTHGLNQDEIDKYSEQIDTTSIQAEMEAVGKKIATYNDIKSRTEGFGRLAVEQDSIIEKAKFRIEELKEMIAQEDKKISDALMEQQQALLQKEKGEMWLQKNPEPSVTEISQRLTEATNHNNEYNRVLQLQERHKELHKTKEESMKLSDQIQAIDEKKDETIKNSKLPIKGLTFTDEEIYFNGLPMEEGQINTAKLIDIGLEISMALNPNLKVVFLHEGSLLDQESLDLIIKKVEKKGYQLIAEIVNNEADVSIEFIESEA